MTNTLLRVLVTLPVSVATAERSFSALRRLKTWLRAHMSETRLTSLTLLYIVVNTEKVIERFAEVCRGERRLEFVL